MCIYIVREWLRIVVCCVYISEKVARDSGVLCVYISERVARDSGVLCVYI